jgi:hypothetical protein
MPVLSRSTRPTRPLSLFQSLFRIMATFSSSRSRVYPGGTTSCGSLGLERPLPG